MIENGLLVFVTYSFYLLVVESDGWALHCSTFLLLLRLDKSLFWFLCDQLIESEHVLFIDM